MTLVGFFPLLRISLRFIGFWRSNLLTTSSNALRSTGFGVSAVLTL
jgi:hypothetical protein